MSKSKNIRNPVGVPVIILNEKYNMLLTMLGNDYLEETYGSPQVAAGKYRDMAIKMQTVGMDKEVRDVFVNVVYACIIHNQYDKDGNIVREIPSVFEMKSNMTQTELLQAIAAINKVENISYPDMPEEKSENPPVISMEGQTA